jgi:hypothetical protein
MIDGIAGDAFSACSLPPEGLENTAMNAEKIIRVSRQRYATAQQVVEEKIRKWSA